jgi:GT2 family glycosyltransferase
VWGTGWRQRLRLAPLFAAVVAADRLSSLVPARKRPVPGPWPAGLTVIIPDRDAPAMLAEALTSLAIALRAVIEPWQVVVVANGAPRATYDGVKARFPGVEWIHSDAPAMLAEALASLAIALRAVAEPSQVVVVANGAPRATYDGVKGQYPDVDWIHSDAPLGFAGAIERGLDAARHGATYLLNNDMTVEADTLSSLLGLRDEGTFAIGSQIFQQDATGRREETGFTDWYVDRAGLHLYHAPVPAASARPEHLCASGGAALFRTALLRRYLGDSRAYDPFYWEDVEWSVRAWRDGFSVVFCPASRTAHRHRATTSRFYESQALARIVERNRVLFDLRHGASGRDASWLLSRVCELPYESQRELASLAQAQGVLRQRLARRRPPQPIDPPALVGGRLHSSYSFRLRTPSRRRLMFVTPFAVFPPRHGGARRVAELVRGQKGEFDVALVSDEASLYDARSFADFDGLCDVRLVQRDDAGVRTVADLATRTREHCHPSLRAAVGETLRTFRPDIVLVEHAELAPLVDLRIEGSRWVLDLHDAYGAGDFASQNDAREFTRRLASYDALTVCSEEDRALVAHPRVEVIPNGATVRGVAYRPSTSSNLVFVGPFRYEPNREGILRFLRDAWPAARAAVPEATLTILGGDESLAAAGSEPAFAQPGVTLLGHRDDVPALLAQSALAINPLTGIRGSAIKLVETLAAGRACVSTAQGARGFASDAPAGLVIVASVAEMAGPIVRLLRDADHRHRIEAPAAALDAYGWHHCVARQRAMFMDLLK